MKTIQECIQFTKENSIFFLATTDDGQPKVRALGLWESKEIIQF